MGVYFGYKPNINLNAVTNERKPLPHIHASYFAGTQIWMHFLDLSNDLITSPSG